MLKTLLKKQFAEIFRSYFYNAKKNETRSKGATIVYILLFILIMVGFLGGVFTYLSVAICGALADAGMDWLYFALMGLLAVFLGIFGSVFNTYSGLYLAKDNDLLLSMPIPVNTIMTARLLGVYLMGLMYSGVVIVPAAIVYWVTVSASAGAIIGSLILIILISIFVLTLSCTLGWVVAKISLKLKNKSFITVLISLLFIGGYYFFYYQAQSVISDLIANAAVYGVNIKGNAYPIYLFGRVGVGDIAAIAIIAAFVLLLFLLMWWLIARSFLKIATASGNVSKKVYKETYLKKKSVSSSLLYKEFKRFLSSPNYMLNCGLGVLLLPIGGIVLLFKGNEFVSILNQAFGETSGYAPILLCAAICFIASMNDMIAPSVSLEGKSLWLLQSLPVTPWQVLRAKLSMQLILTEIPILFCTVCAAFICPYTLEQLIPAFLVPLLYGVFSALFGLFLGLKMPNLSWTSEIAPIKQSGCVIFSLFGGFLYTALFLGLYFLIGYRLGFFVYMSCFAILTLALSAVIYIWLKKKGTVVFAVL